MRNSLQALVESRIISCGRVVRVEAGKVHVEVDGEVLGCELVGWPGAAPPALQRGDRVLIAVPAEDVHAYVLGRVGPAEAGMVEEPATDRRHIAAREIVVEAGSRLELRVGESRIIIDENGTITFQGQNILSRAKALIKIRGAAVRIN